MANRANGHLWVGFVLTSLWLGGCSLGYPPKPFSSEVPPTEAIAQIDEIRSRPVWVRFLNGTKERTAQIGTLLRVGESLRTEADARVQIVLNNGAIARISGNSSLMLNPELQLRADSGLVFVSAVLENGKPLEQDTQVQTPFGMVSTRNGAFYLEIPQQPNKNRRILALHGNITVKLSRTGKDVSLQKGEELLVKSDGTAEKPTRPTQAELESRFANSDLLFGFSTRFAGQSLWESQLKVARREPEQVKFRRSDVARNAPVNPQPASAPPPSPTAVRNDPPPVRQPDPRPEPVQPVTPPVAPDPVVVEPPPLSEPPAPEPIPVIEPPVPEPAPPPQ